MEPVYLGVEIKTREFESRLRTAAHLLKMGIPVVIGQQWSIWENVQTLPRGVALFKTTNEIQAKVMRAFKSAGHTVVALDEEALCCRGAACFLQGMADAAAPNIDLFLAQNKEQQAVLNSKYKNLNIRVVGNPRVDFNQERLAEKQSAAAEIQKKHGEFILFNTNFGCINSVWPDKALKKIAIAAGQDMTTWDARLNWERRHKQEFELLLDWAIANSRSVSFCGYTPASALIIGGRDMATRFQLLKILNPLRGYLPRGLWCIAAAQLGWRPLLSVQNP